MRLIIVKKDIDIPVLFEESYILLKKHKQLVIPFFCDILIGFTLFATVMLLTGVHPLLIGEEVRFEHLLNAKNITIGIIFIIIGFLSWYFWNSLGYLLITHTLANKKKKTSELLRAAWSYLPKFFLMNIILLLIGILPITFMVFVCIALMAINPLLGIPFIILTILSTIPYFFFIMTKFLFAVPIFFKSHTTIKESLIQSYTITTGKFWKVFLIGLIFGLILFVLGSFASSPLQEVYMKMIAGSLWAFLLLPLLLLLALLYAIIITFAYIFLFRSFGEFKRG